MILGAEIGLAVVGIQGLVKGKLTLTKTRVVHGVAARVLSGVALLPIPTTIVVGVAMAMAGVSAPAALIEGGIVILYAALIYAIGWQLAEKTDG